MERLRPAVRREGAGQFSPFGRMPMERGLKRSFTAFLVVVEMGARPMQLSPWTTPETSTEQQRLAVTQQTARAGAAPSSNCTKRTAGRKLSFMYSRAMEMALCLLGQ